MHRHQSRMSQYFGVKTVHSLSEAGGNPVFLATALYDNVLVLCMQSVTKLWQPWVLPTL